MKKFLACALLLTSTLVMADPHNEEVKLSQKVLSLKCLIPSHGGGCVGKSEIQLQSDFYKAKYFVVMKDDEENAIVENPSSLLVRYAGDRSFDEVSSDLKACAQMSNCIALDRGANNLEILSIDEEKQVVSRQKVVIHLDVEMTY